MRIVFDLDGTLALDFGRNYDGEIFPAPLLKLVYYFQNDRNPWLFLFLVTGRETVPAELSDLFTKIICRDFPVQQEHGTYYARYFNWKIEQIAALAPDLVFDDDQQICRYLNRAGIPAVWTPACAFNGITPEAGE